MEHIPWSSLASRAISEAPALRPLRSGLLPVDDDRSSYAVDLAIAQQVHLELDGLGFKLPSRFRKNPKWDELVPVWKFALCLSYDQWLTKVPSKMAPENSEHINQSLQGVFPGFESLTTSPEPVATASHLLCAVLNESGIRYTGGEALLMVNLAAPLVGMTAATSNYQRFYPEVGNFLDPLR